VYLHAAVCCKQLSWSVICKSADKEYAEDISVVCREFLRVDVTPAAVRLDSIITVDYALLTVETRHRATTSMYSLTFRVRVTIPPQYGRNGTAHAVGASMLSPARGVFAGMHSVRVRHACGVRWARRITAGFFHAF